MNPIDDLRGDYKRFLESMAGRDLLTRIVAYETQLRAASDRADATSEQKVTAIDKMNTLYWVRTLLEDLSKPKTTVAPKSSRTR